MTADATNILAHLDAVAAERNARRNDATLGRRVQQLKAYQQARFARTHADSLAHARTILDTLRTEAAACVQLPIPDGCPGAPVTTG